MKKGLNRGALPRDWPATKILDTAKAAGFEGVELVFGNEGELNINMSTAELRALRSHAQHIGLELPSLYTSLNWQVKLTSADANERANAARINERMLEIGHELGANTLLIVPGVVDEQTPYDEAYKRAQEGVAALAAKAKELGVKIGVENVWNKFLLSPLEMARFVDEVNDPFVGAYFDVGNILAYGYPEQWLRILGKRILKCHVKDFRVQRPGGYFVYLLEGDVDWVAVRKAWRDIGYDDYVTVELGPLRYSPELSARILSQSLDTIFGL
jgi:L-ribulose-5-phosphate 3-epimerase